MQVLLDELGNQHSLRGVLGKGGGGKIYQTLDGDVLVKIALQKDEELVEEKEEAFRQVVRDLIFKPIPRDIPLVLPLALLKDRAGYVMRFLGHLKPLGVILKNERGMAQEKPESIHPFWAERYQKRPEWQVLFTHYINTGGTRLRLKLLARLAAILFRLHANGLTYCDLSESNVLFGCEDAEHPVVYLIDADNVCYERDEPIGTPHYQNPEFFKGQSNSIEGDIYTFGILAYWLLTTNHPFLGGKEATDKNWHQCPWVEDRTDKRNAKQPLFSLGHMLIQEAQDFFHTLFEEGKEEPRCRISLALFAKMLELSALNCLECWRCSMHYKDDLETCPYCGACKPRRLCATSYFSRNGKQGRVHAKFAMPLKNPHFSVHLPACLFKGVDLLDMQTDFVEIRPDLLIFKEKEGVLIDNKRLSATRKSLENTDLKGGLDILYEHANTAFSVYVQLKEGAC